MNWFPNQGLVYCYQATVKGQSGCHESKEWTVAKNQIHMTYYYVRDSVARKEITLQNKPTNVMIAEIITKPFRLLEFLDSSTW